jgi:hypothetical protein
MSIYPYTKSQGIFTCPDNSAQVAAIIGLNQSQSSPSTSWSYASKNDAVWWDCDSGSAAYTGDADCVAANPNNLVFPRSYGVNGSPFGLGITQDGPDAGAANFALCGDCAEGGPPGQSNPSFNIPFNTDSVITSPDSTILIADDKNVEVVATPTGEFARCETGHRFGDNQQTVSSPGNLDGQNEINVIGWAVVHGGGMVQNCFYDGHAKASKMAQTIANNYWKADCLNQNNGDRTFPQNVYGSMGDSCNGSGAPSTGAACAAWSEQLLPQEEQ